MMRVVWGVLGAIGVFSPVAEAQLRVVVYEDETTAAGVVSFPHKSSISDDGAIAFMGTVDGFSNIALVWRNGVVSKLAQPGDPVPCGSGTIAGIGDGLGGLESISLRGSWAVFDIYDGGTQRRVGSDNGVLQCIASMGDTTSGGPLDAFQRFPITNASKEILVDDSRLWLVPSQGNQFTQLAGMGATVPVPPMHTPGRAQYWALDDDGDATVAVQTEYLGGDRLHAIHGRPGATTLIEPLGIEVDDTWRIAGSNGPIISVNRAGIVTYEAFIQPPTGPETSGVWSGSPGATIKQFDFPITADGITLTRLFARPHVIDGSHFVAEMAVESNGPPRQAIVRWSEGALTVLATTGEPLPGHPSVMVLRFGGVGVADDGTIFVQVHTGVVDGGVYRITPANTIEKVLATGDTFSIGGIDEVIHSTSFETTFGTGYGTPISATGNIVFLAVYRDGIASALMTYGIADGPPPDLTLEITREYKGRDGIDFMNFELLVTNVGPGTSMFPVFTTLPADYVRCFPTTTTTGASGVCTLEAIAPGDTMMVHATYEADKSYPFSMEISSQNQEDVDPSNNSIAGEIEYEVEDACATCGASKGPPLGAVPLLASFAFVMRRRRRG